MVKTDQADLWFMEVYASFIHVSPQQQKSQNGWDKPSRVKLGYSQNGRRGETALAGGGNDAHGMTPTPTPCMMFKEAALMFLQRTGVEHLEPVAQLREWRRMQWCAGAMEASTCLPPCMMMTERDSCNTRACILKH